MRPAFVSSATFATFGALQFDVRRLGVKRVAVTSSSTR
jgi:hypothetical protein